VTAPASDAELPLRAAIVPVTPLQQNCAILWCTSTMRGAVVDPGGDLARIRQGLDQVGVTAERIVLTHGHIDHAGGAAELAEALSVEIVGPHREDKWLLDALPVAGAEYGIPARPCTPDRWLEENDVVSVGKVDFEVLHCPGHSPGHIVLVNRALNFGVFGDVLFLGSIGRTDLPRGDHAALISAIKTKLLILPDDFFFLCGHGPMSTIGHERQSNPFLV
jgi:glyoxylase-like metal-dependent hydrolase (beta-lactamase superfamily II)